MQSRRRHALAYACAAAAACAAFAAGAEASPLNAGGPVDLLTEANIRIEGLGSAAKVGDKVAPAGDFNGDGINDVMLGTWMTNGDSPTRTQGGNVYIVYGRASPTNVNLAALGANGVEIEGALAGDHLGWSLAPVGDVNGDGKADVMLGAPWADPLTRTSGGSAFVVYGTAQTGEIDLGTLTGKGFRIDGAAANDRAGYAVASTDVNGDGRTDFIVGAIGVQPGGKVDAGAAYVVLGKATNTDVDLGALGTGGFRISGESAKARTGWALAAADLNGDGRGEVAVSGIGASPGGKEASGTTYVIGGRTATTEVDLASLGSAGWRFDGDDGDQSGWSLAAGDVTGDRRNDLVIGVPFHGEGAKLMTGAAYVIKGAPVLASTPLASLGSAGYRIDGAVEQDGAGWSVGVSGDLNRDGVGEVLLGAPGWDRMSVPQESVGAAYVVYGSKAPVNVDLASLGTQGVAMLGGGWIKWGDQAGWNVAGLGDITGQGYNVVSVGVPGWDSATGNANRDRGTSLLLNGGLKVAAEDTTAGGVVPATLSLSLSSSAPSLGAFAAGVGADYSTSITANVITTAGDAALSVTDPSTNAPGHLVNGAFSLPQPLQVRANTGAFAPLGTGPLTILGYTGPISNDTVTIGFKQTIAALDALRTGAYTKTLTFTLSTTNP